MQLDFLLVLPISMNRIILLLAGLQFSIGASAQFDDTLSDREHDDLFGKVKTVRTERFNTRKSAGSDTIYIESAGTQISFMNPNRYTEYDTGGRYLQECYYDSANSLVARTVYRYGADGNLDSVLNMDSSGVGSYYAMTYDGAGNMLTARFYDHEGRIIIQSRCEYDSLNRKILQFRIDSAPLSPDVNVYRYTYDSLGRVLTEVHEEDWILKRSDSRDFQYDSLHLLKIISRDNEGDTTSWMDFYYSPEGLLTANEDRYTDATVHCRRTEFEYYRNGELRRLHSFDAVDSSEGYEYVYDSLGNLVFEMYYDLEPVTDTHYILDDYQYTHFDKQGNWTCKIYRDQWMEVRTITYYE